MDSLPVEILVSIFRVADRRETEVVGDGLALLPYALVSKHFYAFSSPSVHLFIFFLVLCILF